MISSFRNRALERFWAEGDRRGVRADHIKRLTMLLSALDAATKVDDLAVPGFGFHPLVGREKGRFALKVNKNWRVIFAWTDEGPAAVEVDYLDYH